jgi:uncharacterized protein YkwD
MKRLAIAALVAGAVLVGLPSCVDATAYGSRAGRYLAVHIAERRADRGVKALEWDGRLIDCAKQHSIAMVDEFLHSTPEELQPCVDAAIGGGTWVVVGEAIGWGYSVEQVWRLLMKSDAHRRLLMQPKWDRLSIGIYRTVFQERDAVFATVWVYEEV